MQLKIFIFVSFLIFNSGILFSQSSNYSTKSKKAISQYNLAKKAYDIFDFEKAEQSLLKAIKYDGNFIEAHIFLSQVYQSTYKTDKAIESAKRAIAINPDFFPNIYYIVGDLYFSKGEYGVAEQFYNQFLGYKTAKMYVRSLADFRIKCCHFALNAMANPVPFTPISLGPNVNTPWDEYWPSLSGNENTLVVTVKKPIESPLAELANRHQEDFYISNRDRNGEWSPLQNIGLPINTPYFNEGAQSLTADGRKMYFTICKGYCNLYVSELDDNGQWQDPQPLPAPVNLAKSSEKQPSISADGKTLYFVSNRSGGLGDFDIWRSHKLKDNKWSEPQNLGDSINTKFIEQSPYIHFDNQTLYFSSNGHIGMGELDILVSRMINDSTWSTPANLGYPINTHRDEDGLIVNAKGTMAYFSSDINSRTGRDIFMFELPVKSRPTPTTYISGTITDFRSGWPLKANFSLVDLSSNQTLISTTSSSQGTFFLPIPTNRSYAFFAATPGYLFHSEHFDLVGVHSADEPFRKDIELIPLRVGATMVMRNIFFETNSYELKVESLTELNRILDMLALTPDMRIEVGGHTDNVGVDTRNQILSENRAKSVVDFLVGKGVDPKRLTWKGYGADKPIGDNKTHEGRAANRRTEIRITSI
jgi:hypothetical protein